jgi:hypothetical protein
VLWAKYEQGSTCVVAPAIPPKTSPVRACPRQQPLLRNDPRPFCRRTASARWVAKSLKHLHSVIAQKSLCFFWLWCPVLQEKAQTFLHQTGSADMARLKGIEFWILYTSGDVGTGNGV